MELTRENYFSLEMNKKYLSNSQYQGFRKCEAKAMAALRGEILEEPTEPMKQGQYVHAWAEGKLPQFVARNPEIISSIGKTKGELKAAYKKCEEAIATIKADRFFFEDVLPGNHEVLLTAEMFGTQWKCMIDTLSVAGNKIVDLKFLAKLHDKQWNNDLGVYETPFEYRGYFTQMALYCEIERIAAGNRDYYLEPYLAVVTKETPPDKAVISFSSEIEKFEEFIIRELAVVQKHTPRIIALKNGTETPERCGQCDYCRATKVLTGTQHYSQFALNKNL